MWLPPRTCAYCGTKFSRQEDWCPECEWPVDGDLEGEPRRKVPKRAPEPDLCPHCDREFPAGRPACPHCGSDAETGWKDPYGLEGSDADVPDAFTDEDYARTIEDIEFHRGRVAPSFWGSARARRLVIGVLIVLAMTVPLVVALVRMR